METTPRWVVSGSCLVHTGWYYNIAMCCWAVTLYLDTWLGIQSDMNAQKATSTQWLLYNKNGILKHTHTHLSRSDTGSWCLLLAHLFFRQKRKILQVSSWSENIFIKTLIKYLPYTIFIWLMLTSCNLSVDWIFSNFKKSGVRRSLHQMKWLSVLYLLIFGCVCTHFNSTAHLHHFVQPWSFMNTL